MMANIIACVQYLYVLLLVFPAISSASEFSFELTYVDKNYGGNGRPGWVRSGDMDGDGDLDIIAGGGRGLFIYENGGIDRRWHRYGNLDSTGKMGANGAVLFDVDHDGDLDIVSAKYKGELGWWERPNKSLSHTPWDFHRLASGVSGWYTHDISLGDLDKDGKAEEFVFVLTEKGYWNASFHVYWFRPGRKTSLKWGQHTITSHQEGSNNNHAGIDMADIDGDGDIDLSFSNGWFEPSADPASNWIWHKVTDIYGISNSQIRDMDGDGDADLVMSAGHHGQGVYWFENTGKPRTSSWRQHAISGVVGDAFSRHTFERSGEDVDHLHHPECLAALDLDNDTDMDVVSCDLFFGEDPGEPGWEDASHNVYVFENLGNGTSWRKQNIAPDSYPSHLLQVMDMNRDGRMDIISEATGYSIISYFESTSGN